MPGSHAPCDTPWVGKCRSNSGVIDISILEFYDLSLIALTSPQEPPETCSQLLPDSHAGREEQPPPPTFLPL